MSEEKKSKKIEIISGDGELNISPAQDYIDIEKPKAEKEKREIIIPEEKN